MQAVTKHSAKKIADMKTMASHSAKLDDILDASRKCRTCTNAYCFGRTKEVGSAVHLDLTLRNSRPLHRRGIARVFNELSVLVSAAQRHENPSDVNAKQSLSAHLSSPGRNHSYVDRRSVCVSKIF